MRKSYKKTKERRKVMFFGRCERKKYNAGLILAVSALAAVGAVTVMKCGKQMMGELVKKAKCALKSCECDCGCEKDGEE